MHGGLRYLEYYEFRLVREALMEREVLWRIAPHIIRPLRFVLPHHAGLRPAWLLRLGLFLYDHIGGRKLSAADALGRSGARRGRHAAETRPLQQGFRIFRLLGRRCPPGRAQRARCGGPWRRHPHPHARGRDPQADGLWQVTVEDTLTARTQPIARAGAGQCGGPWVEQVLTRGAGVNTRAKVRLVQGSHIVVPKLYEHDRAYIFQNADGRIVFAIPYQDDFTLIGTTDRDYHGDPGQGEGHGRGDRLSLRGGQRIFRQAGEAGGRGLDLCRRAPAL